MLCFLCDPFPTLQSPSVPASHRASAHLRQTEAGVDSLTQPSSMRCFHWLLVDTFIGPRSLHGCDTWKNLEIPGPHRASSGHPLGHPLGRACSKHQQKQPDGEGWLRSGLNVYHGPPCPDGWCPCYGYRACRKATRRVSVCKKLLQYLPTTRTEQGIQQKMKEKIGRVATVGESQQCLKMSEAFPSAFFPCWPCFTSVQSLVIRAGTPSSPAPSSSCPITATQHQ